MLYYINNHPRYFTLILQIPILLSLLSLYETSLSPLESTDSHIFQFFMLICKISHDLLHFYAEDPFVRDSSDYGL